MKSKTRNLALIAFLATMVVSASAGGAAVAQNAIPTMAETTSTTPAEDKTGVIVTEAELAAALAAGGEVVLGADIEVTAEIQIPAGVTATLDLAGHAITSGYQTGNTKHIYPLNNYGTLTIKDSVGTGSITGRGIYVQDGSKLTVESGSIYGIDSNGGSALYQYGGDIVINGGHIEQKAEGTSNFAINAGGGTVTVNGGKVAGNHGAIAAVGARVIINDGEFVCTGSAGMTDNVLYSSGTGTITINGGTFIADAESASGGTCVYDVNGGATINGGNFSNSSGGDVWGTTGTTINGGTFEDLTETSYVTVGSVITNGGETTVKNEDGKMETVVAKIGETTYASLADAVKEANAGDTVVLYADVDGVPSINKAITIKGGKANAGVQVNCVIAENFPNVDGTVTFENLTFNARISTENNSSDQSKMTLKFVDCTFNVPANTYAIQGGSTANTPGNDVLGALVVEGCTFTAKDGNNNYMVYAQCVNSLTITDCIFNGNDKMKGAIHTGDSIEQATVATITGNTISNVARGVQVGNRVEGSSVAISENTFKNVTTAADSKSGAVYVHSNADENVEVTITDNAATDCTKVLYNDGNTITDIVSTFTGNTDDGEEVMMDETGEIVSTPSYLATVNGKGYATFDEAITAANAMTGNVTVGIYGKTEYTDSTASLTGAYDSINFVGMTEDAEISITRNGSNGYISGEGNDAAVSFTDLILSKPAGSYAYDAGNMNVAFSVYRVGAVSYTNCTFPNGACAAGPATTYAKCTIGGSHDKYALWAYGADVTVDSCVFDDDRGIKMYAEGAAKTTSVTVKNSDFSKITGKPAIVLTYGESVTLEGNTYSSTGVFELDKDGAPNGTPVTADITDIACENDNYADCGVLVDGKIYTTVTDAAAVATSGSTVTLMYDSTETVEFAEGVTLDKNGHTAENVTVATPKVVEVSTYEELVAALGEGSDVKLSKDITATGEIEGTDAKIDLNAYKLTLTTGGIYFFGESTVENGTIGITGCVASGDCIIGIGKSPSATLTLNNVIVTGDGYSSAYAVFYVYNESVLTMNGCMVDLKNDNAKYADGSLSGGFIKASNGKNGVVNIADSTITLDNAQIGILDGTVTLDDVTLTITNGQNAINQSALTVKDSILTIKDCNGRALTLSQGDVTIENSTLDFSNCSEGEIRFKKALELTVDDASTINECNIWTDAEGAKVNGVAVTGTEESQNTVTVKDGVTEIKAQPTGTFNGGHINNADPNEIFITTEITNLKATESVVVKIYSDETLIATTTLLKSEYYVMNSLTVKTCLTGDSSSWDTVWEEGMPRADLKPTSGTLYVDGQEMNSAEIQMRDTADAVVDWATLDGVNPVAPEVSGTITVGYTSAGYINDIPAIWGDANFVATESFVVKIYSGETLIATATLNDPDKILLNGKASVATWHAAFAEDGDSWWTTVWEDGSPNTKDIPTKVVLWVDGTEVSENVVKMNGPDDLNPVTWRKLDGVAIADLEGEGTQANPYLISSLAELEWFRDDVNTYTSDGSNQYKGQYVKLTEDIDLDGINWTPIGTNSVGDHMAFLGTFYGEKADGTIPTISNLYVNADGDHLGFFARVGSHVEGITPTVKNLNFNNVDVSSNTTTGHGGSYVGGVIANAGGNSVVSGITVTGDVYVVGYGYVGGIVGHGYPDIDNCHVNANGGSWIYGYFWCVGGIIGYAGEGGTPITNSSVSGVEIWSAYGGAAAIAGLLLDGNTLSNVSASAVKITSDSDYCMGYIAGNGEASTMTNVTVKNVTATAKGETITSTDAVASIGGDIYFDLADAIAAANDGDTVTLLRDITVDSGANAIDITGGVSFTLDFNGYTLTANTTNSGVRININNDEVTAPVVITVKNGTINAGSSAYCALIAAGKSEDVALTVNVEDMTMTNCHNYGFAVKAFAYATINVKDGTEIISTDGQGGVYAQSGSVINVYEGVEIVQQDSATTYMGANLGVSGTGVLNVYGGTFTSDKYNANVMSSGGTLNIYDGTFTSTLYGVHVDSWASTIEDPSVANIYGGTFTAPTVVWVGADAGEKYSATANIVGGTFYGKLDGTYGGEETKLVVSGGTFDREVAAEYCAEDYTPVKNGNGTYGVGKLPNAEVNNLGAITIDEYQIYNGSLTNGGDPINLQIAMEFLAKDTPEEAKANAFGDYTTDFFITITGIANGSFTADGCYLAGNYSEFGWIMIPLDGMEIVDGKVYPVISSVGLDFSYVDICTSVKDFKCGIYFSDEVLAANPDLKVTLALGLSEDIDAAKKAEFTIVDEPYTYDVEDMQSAIGFKGVNLTVGQDLTVNYYVEMTEAQAVGATMNFEFPGLTAPASVSPELYEEGNGVNVYVFRFEHIAPQQLGDEIVATLLIDGEEKCVKKYSIKEYCDSALSMTAADLRYTDAKAAAFKTFIADLLNYGAAAQEYKGYKTDSLVNADLKVSGTTFETLTETDSTLKNDGANGVVVQGATLYFDKANALRIYFTAEDVTNLNVVIMKKGEMLVLGANEIKEATVNGTSMYYVQTADIFATEFDEVYTITLCNGSDLSAMSNGVTVTFSVNSYVYMMQDEAKDGALVKALWCYGASAKQFVDTE